MEHKGVWILAEQSEGRVQRISHELLTRGRDLADKRQTELVALVMGNGVEQADLVELIERGADRVLAIEAAGLEHFLPEPYAACMLWMIREHRPEIVIAGATSTGRTLMPLVAIAAHAGLTADCTVLDIDPHTGNLLQTRPAIGGNIMATIKTPHHRPQMATVRPRSTKPAERVGVPNSDPSLLAARITRIAPPAELLASRVRRLGFVKNAEQHGLQEADAVVAVGRGIKKGENVPMVQKLADSLDAALGATRDVVDRGWLSYPHQIGLSGKTVTPKLYIGVGASGSIQHLAGMQTSETIIAINIDADAQIFKVADIGIVGDLFEVVPVLTKKIAAARSTH